MEHSKNAIPLSPWLWFASLAVAVILTSCSGTMQTTPPVVQAQPVSGELGLSLRNNVVSITAERGDGSTENGFGFIVGEREGELYIATANHVVRRSEQPGTGTKRITLGYFHDQGRVYEAELLGSSDKQFDLAALRAQAPKGLQWRRASLGSPGHVRRGTPVWFIGQAGSIKWYVPSNPGSVNSGITRDLKIYVDNLAVQVGTSGAPLISEDGIIGMIIYDAMTISQALSIDFIQRAFEEWNYPWHLTPTGATPPLSPVQPGPSQKAQEPAPQRVAVRVDSFKVDPPTVSPGQKLAFSGEYSVIAPDRNARLSIVENTILSYYDKTEKQWKEVDRTQNSITTVPGQRRISPSEITVPLRLPAQRAMVTFRVEHNEVSDQKSQEVLMAIPASPVQPSPSLVGLDAADRAKASAAVSQALESTLSGQSVAWRNPDSGNSGVVTPVRTYQVSSGQYCREFTETITTGGEKHQSSETACRQPDGSWKIVSPASPVQPSPSLVGLDAADRERAITAASQALESTPSGQSVTWRNPDSGNSGVVTPVRSYQTSTGQYCREFTYTITTGGEKHQSSGTACRQPDGSWKIVS
jgi:surface antigen